VNPTDPVVSFCDLDSDALGILDDLLTRADLHFEHRPMSKDPRARAPTWVQESVKHLQHLQAGTFAKESKIPGTWISQHANRLALDTPKSWDETRDLVLHSVVCMLSDSTYRKGSKFFPEAVHEWFLCTPPRKPRWSCFLRYANTPRVQGSSLSTDLAEGYRETVPDKPTLRVQRIRNSMTADARDAVQKALGKPGAKTYGAVGWERAGKLYGWWLGSAQYRDQFGDQEDRPEAMRHVVRWNGLLGTFPGLVGLCVRVVEPWGGWFPIPGEPEWDGFCDTVAREYGLWLQEPGSGVAGGHEPVERGEWEKVFEISDY